jgi:nucleotide-binding universal stress UspA family protein
MKTKAGLKPFFAKRILVATDFSHPTRQILPLARALLAKGGRMKLLYVELPVVKATVVSPEVWVPIPDPEATLHAAGIASKHLERIAMALKGVKVEYEVIQGRRVAEEVLKAAKRWKADLICLSTHGRTAFQRMFFGSVAQKVLAHYNKQVLLLRTSHSKA